jgi:hypothetical protein
LFTVVCGRKRPDPATKTCAAFVVKTLSSLSKDHVAGER